MIPRRLNTAIPRLQTATQVLNALRLRRDDGMALVFGDTAFPLSGQNAPETATAEHLATLLVDHYLAVTRDPDSAHPWPVTMGSMVGQLDEWYALWAPKIAQIVAFTAMRSHVAGRESVLDRARRD